MLSPKNYWHGSTFQMTRLNLRVTKYNSDQKEGLFAVYWNLSTRDNGLGYIRLGKVSFSCNRFAAVGVVFV